MTFDQLISWLIPALLLALAGYWKYEQRKTRADTDKLKDQLNQHILHSAKEYATKAELSAVKSELTEEMRRGFSRLEHKLDNRESDLSDKLASILAQLNLKS